MKINDKHKIVILLIALVCNFTFLATAGCPSQSESKKDMDTAVMKIAEKRPYFARDSKSCCPDTITKEGKIHHCH